MFSTLQQPGWAIADAPFVRADGWGFASLSASEEIAALLEMVTETMTGLDYSRQDIFGVQLALVEALENAIKHGHRNDPSKQVAVRYQIKPERVLLEIEDQGQGFDPLSVPDPTSGENIERPCGRGLLLMRRYLSSIQYSNRGNVVRLCKYPSEPLLHLMIERRDCAAA